MSFPRTPLYAKTDEYSPESVLYGSPTQAKAVFSFESDSDRYEDESNHEEDVTDACRYYAPPPPRVPRVSMTPATSSQLTGPERRMIRASHSSSELPEQAFKSSSSHHQPMSYQSEQGIISSSSTSNINSPGYLNNPRTNDSWLSYIGSYFNKKAGSGKVPMSPEMRRDELQQYKILRNRKNKEREKILLANVPRWENDIIPNWKIRIKSKRLRELLWQGVPPSLRGTIWQLGFGNDLQITKDLYVIFQSHARKKAESAKEQEMDQNLKDIEKLKLNESAASSMSSLENSAGAKSPTLPNPTSMGIDDVLNFTTQELEKRTSLKKISLVGRENTVTLIELDLCRTFPALDFFIVGGPLHNDLRHVLETYVCYRPDIGYVQGMSFIASVLLLTVSEVEAFTLLANIINRRIMLTFYRMELNGIQAYLHAFEKMMLSNMPTLYSHVQQLGLNPNMFLIDWVLTIFSKALPLDIAARLWDGFAVYGETFLFRAALALFHMHQRLLLQMKEFEELADFVTHLPPELDVDDLFKSISLMDVSEKKMDEFVEEAVKAENLWAV